MGKVEAGIPEDDARNPATIADNVGDNVGDCAGMAADLFESYEVTLVASIILGVPAFQTIFPDQPGLWAAGALFPLGCRAIGVLASIVGVFVVQAPRENDRSAMTLDQPRLPRRRHPDGAWHARLRPDLRGQPRRASSPTSGWRMFGAVVAGLVLAQVASRITEYFTSTHTRPVQEIAEAARTGPATVGAGRHLHRPGELGVGHRGHRRRPSASPSRSAAATSSSSSTSSALTGMGMLATTGVVVSEDTFGPVADNAAGIAEMSGEFHGEPEKIMVGLDAVGNTTKAVTKGFAIGSAVIAAVALFASFIETISNRRSDLRPRRRRAVHRTRSHPSTWPTPRRSSAC